MRGLMWFLHVNPHYKKSLVSVCLSFETIEQEFLGGLGLS